MFISYGDPGFFVLGYVLVHAANRHMCYAAYRRLRNPAKCFTFCFIIPAAVKASRKAKEITDNALLMNLNGQLSLPIDHLREDAFMGSKT